MTPKQFRIVNTNKDNEIVYWTGMTCGWHRNKKFAIVYSDMKTAINRAREHGGFATPVK